MDSTRRPSDTRHRPQLPPPPHPRLTHHNMLPENGSRGRRQPHLSRIVGGHAGVLELLGNDNDGNPPPRTLPKAGFL